MQTPIGQKENNQQEQKTQGKLTKDEVLPAMTPQEIQDKVLKYEDFVNDVLKPDLEQVFEARDKYYHQLAQYLELRNKIKFLQEHIVATPQKPLKTMVNLSSEFYAEAKVRDPSKIILNIGMGFHVEVTLNEALELITDREKMLTQKADQLTKKAADIKTRIKLIYHAIGELYQLGK